jgi:hypothetical protein
MRVSTFWTVCSVGDDALADPIDMPPRVAAATIVTLAAILRAFMVPP